MRRKTGERHHWPVVMGFAIAMAWAEAATVYYLRVMTDRIDPYQARPMPLHHVVGQVELVREVATLLMLTTVGMLAARQWQRRLAYTAMAFGTWDIFYYVFLRLITGWPTSLFAWDILFLLPLPWWGPVLAPVLIALLLIAWGTLTSQQEHAPPALRSRAAWGMNLAGVGLALYVFMADTLRVAGQGVDAVRVVLPGRFNWPLFGVALMLMSMPVLAAVWQTWFTSNTAATAARSNESNRLGAFYG